MKRIFSIPCWNNSILIDSDSIIKKKVLKTYYNQRFFTIGNVRYYKIIKDKIVRAEVKEFVVLGYVQEYRNVRN